MPKFRIAGPGGAPRELDVDGDVVTIGRAPHNHIVVEDPSVEPSHCAVERSPEGEYRLVDLESACGTRLNGKPVRRAPLAAHDEITIGSVRIVVEALYSPAAVAARPRAPARRRRWGPVRRRRLILPSGRPPPKIFTYDDLKVVIESLVEQEGVPALDRISGLLDEYHEEFRGTKLLAYLRGEVESLYRVLELNRHLTQEHDPKRVLDLILDGMIELTGAERAFVILREGESLDLRAARNLDREDIAKAEFKISRTLAERVITTGRPILSLDAMNDPDLPASESVTELALRSVACLPLRTGGSVIGCVYLDNRFETAVFLQSDLPLLEAFAEQAAISLGNARLLANNVAQRKALEEANRDRERLNDLLRQRLQVQYHELQQVRLELLGTRRSQRDYPEIVGESPAIRGVLALLDRIAESDEPVFLTGESGTGKELVARAIHANSRRKDGPFVSENCAAIPETLFESELFGHERGAFTGAVAAKKGLFELAHGGTLFLDEVADMPPEMQKKLLRALQEGTIRRVGGTQTLRVDVRVLSASNRNVPELVRQGGFREDLLYRLNVVPIEIPPLRDRRADIPLLADHFLGRIASEHGAPKRGIDESALWLLLQHDWPGNVRELENEIRRAVALSDGQITAEILKKEIRDRAIVMPGVRLSAASPLRAIVEGAVEEAERRAVLYALEQSGWKKIEAARMLGISRPTLDAKMDKYRLERTTESQPQ